MNSEGLSGNLTDLIKGLTERLDRLENTQKGRGRKQFYQNPPVDTFAAEGTYPYNRDRTPRRRDIICHNCGRGGHVARFCYQQSYAQEPRQPQSQPGSLGSYNPRNCNRRNQSPHDRNPRECNLHSRSASLHASSHRETGALLREGPTAGGSERYGS